MKRSHAPIILGLALFVALGAPRARAENVNLGLFAPSAPFPSTAARVELAKRLGEYLGKTLGGTGAGRNFARASDFAAAVKKGEVVVALVDPAFLANSSASYVVIAGAVRGGATSHAWQLVGRDGDTIGGLKGKRVLVPGIGGRESELVTNVLLGGDVGKDYFRVETAPDTVSALAALGLGKTDAAVVPAGAELPAGTSVVLSLPVLPGPVLVAYGLTLQQKQALATAVSGFGGDATISGFRAADADAVRGLGRRFAVPVKRGPLAAPAVRLVVGDLVEGRAFAIERTPVTAFALSPPAR